MRLATETYLTQAARWPRSGRHVLASYDEETIVVYQAYRAEIARWAVEHQQFGGPWSFGRMSWVKPNFLWMMYRSSWGTAEGQEHVLAVRITRAGFDAILADAVESSHRQEIHGPDRAAWEAAGKAHDVRFQWDPDHDPTGQKLERRAIQLGLRGEILARYAKEWIVSIDDLGAFVAEQRQNAHARFEQLLTPTERVYEVRDPDVARRLRVDAQAIRPGQTGPA